MTTSCLSTPPSLAVPVDVLKDEHPTDQDECCAAAGPIARPAENSASNTAGPASRARSAIRSTTWRSPEVRAHMARFGAADVIVAVFPVWWFAPPAVLKGWIDRVWNHGFAYGAAETRLAGKRMLWLGLAGGSSGGYAESGLAAAMDTQLRMGISNFCGIEDAELRLIHDTETAPEEQVLADAETAAADFLFGEA
ncbi:NAD(P)H-dependent oxidoreductase [Saccharopolyspora shandongensis]|uniref:NAD(P)H-dependent oxidoreductase n=1 Tax=Saccharopolyspora shandongensis TaxID=418495 RepID=UPI0033EB3641